jgi:predicted MFS family arabinose efflux permease
VWGWGSLETIASLVLGVALLAAFVRWERSVEEPLIDLKIFRSEGFRVDNTVLGMMSAVFLPFFFFASVYAQISLGKSASNAGVYLLYFFVGFVVMAQVGGRILDRRGARPAVVIGSAIAAVGFYLLAGKLTDLSLGAQTIYIIIAGGGIGMMLGPVSTDAVNRAPSGSYSEVTGITQTSRNFGASVGLAVLGTILLDRDRTNVASTLRAHGVPAASAHRIASSFGSGSASGSSASARLPFHHAIALAAAHSSQMVFYVMAGIMAATFVVALLRYPRGRVESVLVHDGEPAAPAGAVTDAG